MEQYQSSFVYKGKSHFVAWIGIAFFCAMGLAWFMLAAWVLKSKDPGMAFVPGFFGLACISFVAWIVFMMKRIRREPEIGFNDDGFTVGKGSDRIPWDQIESMGLKWFGKGKTCLRVWFRYRADGEDFTLKLGSLLHSGRSVKLLTILASGFADKIALRIADSEGGGEVGGIRYGLSGFRIEGEDRVALENVHQGLFCIEFVDRITSVLVLYRRESKVRSHPASQHGIGIRDIPIDMKIRLDLNAPNTVPHLVLMERALKKRIAKLYRHDMKTDVR